MWRIHGTSMSRCVVVEQIARCCGGWIVNDTRHHGFEIHDRYLKCYLSFAFQEGYLFLGSALQENSPQLVENHPARGNGSNI